jgi:hypothetical protein
MTDLGSTARRMWALFESVHIVSYFAAEPRAEFERSGLRGYWRGYFAGRAAPIGEVGAAPVIAAFFSFAPAMVARAVPSIWDVITPAEALRAREAGAVAAMRNLLGLAAGQAVPDDVAQAADLLAAATADIGTAGRPLGAPNAALPIPGEPLARLWHAATVLREHRGDGHVAALVAADIDGAEALVLRSGVDLAADGALGRQAWGWTRDQLQPIRGWDDAQWDAAAGRLASRGLLRPDGAATPAGVARYEDAEQATDRAAARPWAALGADRTERLAALLEPVAAACAAVRPAPAPPAAAPPAAAPLATAADATAADGT